MQKITLDEIDLNEELVLARPVILGTGVKGFSSGVPVSETVLAALKRLGFHEVWVRGKDEQQVHILSGDDDEEEADQLSKTEKYSLLKNDIAVSLADIMTEKDPQREMLRIRNISRGAGALMKRGALTTLDPDRPPSQIKALKIFSESVISVKKLEKFQSMCYDLIEKEFAPHEIDKVQLNLNDNRIEGSYLFNHMANCGLYFLATLQRYNADLKKKGAVSSELKYSPGFDHKKRKETLFFYSDEEVMSGTLAAFMHDVGYLHDGMAEILFKDGRIGPEEHNILKKHVEVTMNVIQYHIFFTNRPLAKTTIENHHERLDGSGYPKHKTKLHTFAKILGMIDCFDSMVIDRPWRKKFSRAKVLEWLYDSSEVKTTPDGTIVEPMFDRDLVIAFEQILMLYEVGEVVDLYHVKSTDPIFKCVIKEQNKGRPDRPVVELIKCYTDPNKQVEGKVLNLKNLKDLYLGESTDFRKEPIV